MFKTMIEITEEDVETAKFMLQDLYHSFSKEDVDKYHKPLLDKIINAIPEVKEHVYKHTHK